MAQAPANSNALGMGRPLFDRAALESALAAGNWTALVEAMISIQDALTGMGYACGAKDGDEKYQNVVAQFVDPDWVLYAGRPDTPLTPDVIPGLAGGGEITIERDNSVIQATATIINFSTNFSVTDAGGGQVDVDVTGGGGGTTYTASTPLVISGSNDISLQFGFGLLETANTLVFNNGHGLEDNGSGAVRVKAHTLIDVDANGVSVDFTEGSGYSGSSDQYWRNNNGTFQWATLPPDQDTTYTAGAGINLTSTKFVADPNNPSHVGLVDPTTGDDSSADDAEIGILWHEIQDYDETKYMLIGHEAGDTTKPVVQYKTVVDWLETIPDWDATKVQLLLNDGENDGNEMRWLELKEVLKLLFGWTAGDMQSIGHDAAGDPEWQDDTDACP